jgi:23S rRNA G2445 N2-methylase RlmL
MKVTRKDKKKPSRKPARSPYTRRKSELFYEVTCCTGLERFVQRELRRRFGELQTLSNARKDGEIMFEFKGAARDLLSLATIHDPFLIIPIESPRPRGLLEPLVYRKAIEQIAKLRSSVADQKFTTFSFSAAGSDTKDLKRIREAFSKSLDLPEHDQGELYMRLRKSKANPENWELLVRISARPVSHRAWRVAHFRGALDASIARVLVELVAAKKNDVFVDLMCGSGTITIEQLSFAPVKEIFAFDTSKHALECAELNCKQVKSKTPYTLVEGDACATELPDQSIDVIVSNPPWGESIGKKQSLGDLYRNLLKESARLLRKGGRMALIVQDIEVLNVALKEIPQLTLKETHRALQARGYHPTILLLERR